jgi:hypothetical protein
MRLILGLLGLVLVAAIGAVAMNAGYERYKEWVRHHKPPSERPAISLHQGPGAGIIAKELLDMSEGETSWHHNRDVTRQGDTWDVEGQTFDNALSAAHYL